MSHRIPTSSYAQLQARRNYYRRNREIVKLMSKMSRAGIRMTTAECRTIIAKESGDVHRGES